MRDDLKCWENATGEGWNTHLVRPFLEAISGCPEASVLQIKEKFGLLCIYVSGPEWVMNLAQALEEVSGLYCEECGRCNGWQVGGDPKPADVRTHSGGGYWILTRCQWCDAKWGRARLHPEDKENI